MRQTWAAHRMSGEIDVADGPAQPKGDDERQIPQSITSALHVVEQKGSTGGRG